MKESGTRELELPIKCSNYYCIDGKVFALSCRICNGKFNRKLELETIIKFPNGSNVSFNDQKDQLKGLDADENL